MIAQILKYSVVFLSILFCFLPPSISSNLLLPQSSWLLLSVENFRMGIAADMLILSPFVLMTLIDLVLTWRQENVFRNSICQLFLLFSIILPNFVMLISNPGYNWLMSLFHAQLIFFICSIYSHVVNMYHDAWSGHFDDFFLLSTSLSIMLSNSAAFTGGNDHGSAIGIFCALASLSIMFLLYALLKEVLHTYALDKMKLTDRITSLSFKICICCMIIVLAFCLGLRASHLNMPLGIPYLSWQIHVETACVLCLRIFQGCANNFQLTATLVR